MRRRILPLICLLISSLILVSLLSGCVYKRYKGPYAEENGDFGGIDDLERILPLSGQAPEARDRKVGIFYFLWQGEHGRGGPYDNYKIVLEHPEAIESEENWFASGGGKVGEHHFWGEPMFGYYCSTDGWVTRKHVQMLTDAGIDFIVFDTTNNPLYLDRVRQLIGIWYEYLDRGVNVPKLAFYTATKSAEHIVQLYHEIYTNDTLKEQYPRLDELWYNWDGKPMIIGADWLFYLPVEIEEYFTIKDRVWPNEGRTDNAFPWMEFSRLYTDEAVYGVNGRKEVVNVSVAQHNVTISMSKAAWYGGQDHTRSYRDGAVDRSPGAVNYGYNFADQWEWAISVDPEMVFVTGWNEWVAQRQKPEIDNVIRFVDCCDPEASRDIEPVNGLWGDNYYMQLISYMRLYKGTAGRVATGGKITIDIDGGFGQWDDSRITARYTDYANDTADREAAGFGDIVYTDRTGRNDFVKLKAARDRNYIYFYAETADDVTPRTDDNWMTLFIASGAWRDSSDLSAFWLDGIDFAVNLEKPSGDTAIVSRYSGGSWLRAGECDLRVSGNKMMIRISKKLLGIEQGIRPLDVQFKWADNYQYNEDGTLDVWTFYKNGDSAPLGRLTYVFSERQ